MPSMLGFDMVRKVKKAQPDLKIILVKAFKINKEGYSISHG
jgi:YesN/AraC family two-component response regulator